MSDDSKRPIIIKKKKSGGHGHHGGAWKVAYADFVTAMMAFFLMLWLLSSTSEETKAGLADYFDPTTASISQSGSGGVGGGKSMITEGARISDASPLTPVPTKGSLSAGNVYDKIISESESESVDL